MYCFGLGSYCPYCFGFGLHSMYCLLLCIMYYVLLELIVPRLGNLVLNTICSNLGNPVSKCTQQKTIRQQHDLCICNQNWNLGAEIPKSLFGELQSHPKLAAQFLSDPFRPFFGILHCGDLQDQIIDSQNMISQKSSKKYNITETQI